LESLLRFVPRHAVAILLVSLLLTLAAASQLVDFQTGEVRLRFDPSVDRLLPEGDEARAFYDRVRRLFGSDETLVVALVTGDVFTTETLERVADLTRNLEGVEGVHHVLSLTNAVNVRGVDDDLEIAPFVGRDLPRRPDELAELRREVLGNPIYAGNLVSRDARATALIVTLREMSNRAYLDAGIDERIMQLADEGSGDAETWVTGGPHIRAETARVLLGEALTIPLGILAVLAGVLALSFRSVRGVTLPLITIGMSVTWTLGLTAFLGYELNAVTALVPAMLTTLGLSYAVHVVSEYAEPEAGDAPGPRERVAVTLGRVALPVALTGLTTAAGFASLALSPLGAVREFGWISVIGVVSSVLASLSVTPAALSLLPLPRERPPAPRGRGPSFDGLVERAARFVVAQRPAIFLASALVFALALAGAAQLRIGTQQVSQFREDAPVRVHFEAVNQSLEGANLFYVVLETEYPEGFKEPVNLVEVEALQQWLLAQPEIGGTTSLVDYLKLLNRGFHGNDPERLTIPETKRIVSQLLFFGGSEELESLVDSRYQTASIRVRANVVDSDAVAALSERIEARLGELPSHLDATLTGTSIVFTRTLDAIIRGQTGSVIAAFGIIYVILAALFVSPRIGLVALIPNVLPVAFYFGALGWSGIRLDPATSLIAPMILGIAVDDTIHYFARFIRDAKRLGDERRATVSALRAVGRPVTYTSIALCLGFLMLNASEVRANAELGTMAALALAFAWLTDFTLTPALCLRLRIATLWDLLRLDLGHDPHHTIRLFRGMRAAQARIVASLSQMLEVPAGRRLFSAGEPGDALYIVIEGRLRASVATGEGGDASELAIHTRGGVLGEVGLFRSQRIADVDVVDNSRLLRVSVRSIEHLERQHPRIATIVFRNLNELLSERVAKAAAREVLHTQLTSIDKGSHREEIEAKARMLGDAFFEEEGGAFREQMRERGRERDSVGGVPAAEALAPMLFDRMASLGIDADSVAALTLIPLVEVAWADGRMDDDERRAVLAGAGASGIAPESPSFRMLEKWLAKPPPPDMLAAWREFIRSVCQDLSVEGQLRLRAGIMGNARAVAEAAGGLLGFGSVSRSEERELTRLERAFDI
jgi:predicted RND superfamily exporter protein/CRP-like cAMP-binding protein